MKPIMCVMFYFAVLLITQDNKIALQGALIMVALGLAERFLGVTINSASCDERWR